MLGEFEIDQKYIRKWITESLKPQKNHSKLGNSVTDAHILGEDLLSAFCKFSYLRLCATSNQWENIVR